MKTPFITLKGLFLLCFLLISTTIYSHAVQVAYGVNCNGDLRLYVEHWHSTEDPSTTTMNIQISIGGVITSVVGSPSGSIQNTLLANLPGSAVPIVVFGQGTAANTYNDWVWYDFTGVPANTPIIITVQSGNTVFTEGSGGASVQFPRSTAAFIIPQNVAQVLPNQSVCGGQTSTNAITFLNSAGTTWTNSNPSIGLPASGVGNIPSFLPTASLAVQTAIITYSTQCAVGTMTIVAQPAPNSNFTPSIPNNLYCKNSVASFNITDQTSIGNVVWNFGDGSTSTSLNPTHSYATVGTFSVKLDVFPAAGTCTSSTTNTVTVYAPTSNFNLSNSCLNVASNFTSTSTSLAAIVSETWSWGDGTANGMGSNPSHAYTTPGTYNVKIVSTDVGLCKDSITHPITIYPNPVMNFNSNSVCLNTTMNFVNNSTVAAPDNISSWLWNFGDGSGVSVFQNPSYIYSNSGNFNAVLTATTNNGCVNTTSLAVKVNPLPIASFALSNACVNSNVVLNNMSSISAPDNISVYAWNFGAGANPANGSAAAQNTLVYNTPGIKFVKLNLMSNNTCTATATQTVEVYGQPVANFNIAAVCQGSTTTYTDLSTASGSIANWAWDFTNNASSDNFTNSPSNVFPSSGTYTTSLIVTDNNGCKDTIALPLNVWGHTIPDFSPDKVCFGTSSAFTNLTNETTNANTGLGATYVWDFADGSAVATSNAPSHTYTLNGNGNAIYNVTLTATSFHGCVDNIIKPVNVYSIPTASFTSDSVCLGGATHLTDASNGNGNVVNAYAWDFLSDGTIDVTGISNPNFTFPAYGNNSVTYTVSASPVAGLVCSNSISSIQVWVNPLPLPDFTFVNKCINTQPNAFNASVSTIPVGTNVNYAWAYGDGLTGNGINVTHNYATASAYNVTLTVTSAKGCVANKVKTIDVYQKPLMSIVNSSACNQKAMTFTATPLPNSGVITDWYWDYNNSINTIEASGQPIVSTIFPAAGTQTVYLVTVSNPGQCRDTMFKQIYIDYVPKPLFSVDKPSGCPEHCVKFTDNTLPITGPGVNANWKWIFGDGTVVNAGTNLMQSHCYQNTTGNQVNLFDVKLVVTSDKGCSDSLQNNAFITVFPTPTAQYTVNPNPGNIVTPLISFNNESQDYTQWWWSFGEGPYKSDSVNVNPTHFYNDATSQNYYSNLIVKNQYGCSDTAFVTVEVGPEFTFYIPNAFSPSNEDGINDFFFGLGIGIADYEMWIFDRWGERVFYSDEITKGWNGKVQGKSGDGKQEIYVWKVKLKDVLGKKHEYVGHVTLLK